MPDRSPLELAKQGDPQAIATVINHSLKAQAISADVFREGNSLHIMLEGDSVPGNQGKLVAFLRNGLTKLDISSIYTAKVYGRQLGDDPAWEEEIVLKMPPPEDVEPDGGEVLQESLEPEEDLDVEDPLMDDGDDDMIDADEDEDGDLMLDDRIDEEEEEDYYNPEEDDDLEEDEETEEIESQKPKSKLIWLIPLLLILAIAALLGLHFGGILALPFLPGGSSESEPVAPTPEETVPTETPPEGEGAPAEEAPAEEAPAEATDPWRDGINAAMSAAQLAQTAQSQAEWNQVASEWQKASELMGQVPESSPNYQAAQERVQQYAQNQQIAQQRATGAPN